MQIKEKIQRHKLKVFIACALLASFCAGFIFAWLRGHAADAYINNHTPIKTFNQYAQSSRDPNCPIKAKRKKSGPQFYHLPGDVSYKRLKATDCFQSEEQAKAAGFVAPGQH